MSNKNNYFMRWSFDKCHPTINTLVSSPFEYKKTILRFLSQMNPDETIEFICERSTIMQMTVKNATDVLNYVSDILHEIDIDNVLSIIGKDDFEKLKAAAPWDFWNNKEIQDIVSRILKR